MKNPLDRESFEAAKSKCGLADATFFNGGKAHAYADFQTLVPEPAGTLVFALLSGALCTARGRQRARQM